MIDNNQVSWDSEVVNLLKNKYKQFKDELDAYDYVDLGKDLVLQGILEEFQEDDDCEASQFISMTDCMNQAWRDVKLSFKGSLTLDNDTYNTHKMYDKFLLAYEKRKDILLDHEFADGCVNSREKPYGFYMIRKNNKFLVLTGMSNNHAFVACLITSGTLDFFIRKYGA